MSFQACLARLREEGTIDGERAARFEAEWDRLNRAYGKTMGTMAAAEHATFATMQALDWQLLQQRRSNLMQIGTQRALLKDLSGHVGAGGKAGQFAIALMEHHEAVPGVRSVENTRGALSRLAWTRMNGFLTRYSRDLLGQVRHAPELADMVRALRGEKVENASAREMAAAAADTFEWLRQLFNNAGGAIPRLDDWGLPQSHDALGVAQAGLEAWRAFIKPFLAPGKMIDNTTGQPFASAAALDEALEAAWRNIASEGMDGRVPGAFNGEGKLANRRTDHRFLVFEDADAWLAYNERFGGSDVFGAVTGHIESMTRDIAAMQVLGANPALTVRWIDDLIQQGALPPAAGGGKFDGKAARGARVMGRMWRYYTGELTAVAPDNRETARFFAGVRNWNVMTRLGRAFLAAAPTDPVLSAWTRRFNGLPVSQTLDGYGKSFNPANAEHRAMAEHAGLVVTEMTSRAEILYRNGKVNKLELTRRGADALLRATGLTPHTVASKQALGLGFQKDWAEHAGTAFDQLGRGNRLALERYGIDAGDWDRLRAMEIHEQGGYRLLQPGELARSGGDEGLASAIKFMSLIDAETRFGTPSENLRAQSKLAFGGAGSAFERGTYMGELAHSATQFKTYPVIMLMTHMQRALYGRGGMSRAEYGLTLPLMLTLAGTLAYSLRTVAQGEDWPDWSDPRTWAAGMAVGGGTSMIGEFVMKGMTDDRGTSVAGFAAGPTLGTIVDPAFNLTLGNIGEAARGEETNIEREAFRLARRNLPGGNAWYAQVALDRLLLDQLETIADPDYRKSWRRMERHREEQGRGMWWPRDDGGVLTNWPERAPEMSNSAEGTTP